MLNPKLTELIADLRRRVRRYVLIDSVLGIAAVVLLAFWIGFLLDYVPVRFGGTEMPAAARSILLIATAIAVAYLVVTRLMQRLRRRLPDDSLALLLERHHPEFGGRLVTTVQLHAPDRSGDAHDPKLLEKVHAQTIERLDRVDPKRVFNPEPLRRKAWLVVPLMIAFFGWLVASPRTWATAVSRLTLLSNEPWPRRADLEMVGIEIPVVTPGVEDSEDVQLIPFVDGVARLPRGTSGTLRIRARADGAEVPLRCTLYYTTEDGVRGQSNLRRVGRVRNGYQSFVLDASPMASIGGSMSIDVRGLDDRLDGLRIEAITPPALVAAEVEVRYPDYLREVRDDETPDRTLAYQSGLRIREGSDVQIVAQSSRPLGEVPVWTQVAGKPETGRLMRATVAEDRMSASISLPDVRQSRIVQWLPSDPSGISAQLPYRYQFGVIKDSPPELSVALEGIGGAITADARIPMRLVATDDYGVRDLNITTVIQGGSDAATGSPPSDQPDRSHIDHPTVGREGAAQQVVDLRELDAADRLPRAAVGDSVLLVAEALDRYDLEAAHATRAETIALDVVTPDTLLSLLQRRELELRARLEQTLAETQTLRQTLLSVQGELADLNANGDADAKPDSMESEGEDTASASTDPATNDRRRAVQRIQLRVQQASLQLNKTRDELSGVVQVLGDLVAEMINNRVDTVDRQDRLTGQVQQPLQAVIEGPLATLAESVTQVERESVDDLSSAVTTAGQSVASADETILALTAVLEKMLDLESYNEILDLVRGLIEDQDELLEDTKSERKKRVLDLFN